MTTEDKLWIGGGIALALGGGIYYFVQKGKDKSQDYTQEIPYEEVETTEIPIKKPILATAPIVPVKTQLLVKAPVLADSFRYSIGQEIMATGFNGTKAYDARKMADGNYISEGIRKATFKKGDKIGTIIWVGRKPDGTYRYVAQRNGMLLNDIYWIADQDVIKPIGKILPTIVSASNLNQAGIDKNKLLKKGSKGAEVRALQTLLKVKVDGDFGRNTENALFTQKGVKQIKLNDFK
ncbi:peptidoglycan-binding domain-containing protein [Flavobacterium aquatile]|uniref:Peptidoglycan binding-like domain-containing protein n=1 Tax=Flavobacterium aquatile LMG 4008 = ATCC 11947 TaxID=1453498 RepID=A0A095SQI1_9FLAO|nr:hypothetical protein [Flavobacterium aquatile]KGD66931.1 hypothetical protein LG45_16020 [Flavobacterium aquatile LMG 4008 = ATCC 11947]OXA68024.1 hypothetical protein B0A61_06030 [Flavobacterium aquatile LMG 4008 = ATCC 11947]GEC80144.1 hypothetical protein FAQ01_30140 [Flavobacterium aquatile]